jgi:Asp-tRNA(Asn)/Glu-tRNA(Gln) amidotransferase A subunit family amidase
LTGKGFFMREKTGTRMRTIRVALPEEQREWLSTRANAGAAIRQAIWLLMATEARIEEKSTTGARPDNAQME